MFRNRTMQRAIATLMLASLGSGFAAPLLAYAKDQPVLAGGTPLLPLQAANPGRGAVPWLDANGIPTGKGRVSLPAVAAVTAAAAKGTPEPVNSGQAEGDALGALQDLARKTLDQLAAGQGDALAQTNLLRTQYAQVLAQQNALAQVFAATEAHLKASGIGGEVLQRHQAAVAQFSSRSQSLRGAMASLDAAAAGKGAPLPAISQLGQLLEQFPSRAAKHGKAALPWGQRKDKPHKVALTPREHERRFPRSVQLAAAGTLSGIALPDAILPDAVQPGDLAADGEVQLTPDIRALAASLGNNPVAIYNWVRNNVQYAPGYGAMQGAAATLQARRGNAFDTASLLIALYRAAGTPARYVYGTVELPVERLRNWLGVDNTAAAQTLLTQAGIPNRAVAQAGQTASVQIEHVWVEALVDYTPSRGGVNKTPASWVPMDASFKQMDGKAALDLRGAVSLNEAGLFDSVKQGAACTPDYGQNLNLAQLQTAYGDYKTQLGGFLSTQGADLTVGQVLGSRTIAARNYGILLGSLPYQTVAQGAIVNTLPDNLRWQFRLQLYAGATEQGQGQSTVALNTSLTGVAGKRITLSFAPATQADADVLASYMPKAHADGSPVLAGEFPADVPGYLIRVKAELRADGALLASGGSFVLGSELAADIGSFDPASGNWNSSDFYPHAGDYHAVAIDAQGVGAAQLGAVKARLNATQARLAAGQTSGLGRDDVTGDLLYQAALGYFATADANGAVFQRAAGVLEQRLPSYGRAVAQVAPQMVLGIVSKASFPGVTLDIDRLDSAVAVQTGGLDGAAYVRQADQRNAAYGHLILSRLLTSAQTPGQAASAINALAGATAQGQQVYALTSSNAAAVLPQISLDETTATELQDSTAAGYRALVARSSQSVGGWSGQGVLVEDSDSGAGSYRLHGVNGAATAALYLPGGMGWLALAEPFQSAASAVPAAQAAQQIDATLVALLGDTADTTRWTYYAGQADVASGLFVARLAAAQGGSACDALIGVVAANLDTTGGFNGGGAAGAPVITSAPVIAAGAAQLYSYAVQASDPSGAALSYSLSDAPTGMRISATGVISWNQAVAGTYNVTVRADNGKAYAEQRYQLTVSQQAAALQPSLVVTPAVVNLGESVTIDFVSSGGSGNVAKNLSIDGQPVALTADGRAVVTAVAVGAHQISASASDSLTTITRAGTYSVRDLADSTTPVAIIASPLDDAEVTGPLNISGTAAAQNLAYYQLLLRPAGAGNWNEIARGTSSVANGVLGKLDPTQLANGIYELVLSVVDANGRQQTQLITLDIYRDLKIGQFAISFLDLNVEASGIPIRVTRTYDTRNKSNKLDFGYGWTVDYQSVQVRKNMVLGLQWDVVAHPAQLLLCLVPSGKRKINVTLPTGKVERFTAANARECALAQIPEVNIQLTALAGTTSTMEIVNVPTLMTQGGQLYDLDHLEPWNPKEFKLTTEDNYVYYLTEGIGITQITDPSGNILTYGQNGIVHSNGQSVAFTRDASQRITAITDPAGNAIRYGYNAAGDLVSVTSRTNAVSKFSYNSSHGLVDYTDPNGTVTARYTYDADGRLVAKYDADGKAIELGHDLANNREVVTDRRGNTTAFRYDDAGNVTEVIDALGNKTSYVYDALGNETTVTDALGHTVRKTFDAKSGKQLTEQDALGNSSSWSYDPATVTVLQNAVDARGNQTFFTYGEHGQAISEPLGRVLSFGNDAGGNLTRMTVAGVSTLYEYDGKGNRIKETDAAGNVTSYTFDANNKELSRSWSRVVAGSSQPLIEQTHTVRDADGRVIAQTDAAGNVSKTEYNLGGQVTATVDPSGRRTMFEYNARGRLIRTTYTDGSTQNIAYDAENNKISITDPQGRTTRYEYDALNRPTKTSYPDGSSSTIEYDAAGQVVAAVDINGNRTLNIYDAAGRLVMVKEGSGRTTQFSYDANGNRTSVTDTLGNVTSYEYDALNRLVKTTRPDGKFATTIWNLSGTKQAEIDASGNRTDYAYDALSHLIQVTQTNGATAQVTAYAFDSAGNRITQTDAEGRTTRWEYDANRRVTSRTLPDGQRETFSYDVLGNRTGQVAFNGKVTTTDYDPLGRPVLTSRADGARIANAYTAAGQVASVTVTADSVSGIQTGTTRYSYDVKDRLVRQINPDGSFLAFAYDGNGNITQRSTKSGTVNYAYDANDHLSTVTDSNGGATQYTYDLAGKLASTRMPNGILSTRSYDVNGRLLQVLHQKADGSVVTGVRYGLAPHGQRLLLEEFDGESTVNAGVAANPVRSSAYSYDNTGRLTQEKVSDRSNAVVRTVDYAYDKVGNRNKKTETSGAGVQITSYSYDANDRLAVERISTVTGSVVQANYRWDDNGNLISKSVGTTVTFYEWNGENRLVQVKQGGSADTAQLLARYTYDANGNRIAKLVPGPAGNTGTLTSYLVDPTFPYAQTLEESVATNGAVATTQYVWGLELIEQIRAGAGTFYHADGLGSVKALTYANSDVAGSYQYDPFGNLDNVAGTADTPYRYAGEYFDDTIGLQYNRARYYSPATGRFTAIDPISGKLKDPLSQNKYIYANANPVSATDPSGLETLESLEVGMEGESIVGEGILEGGASTGAQVSGQAANAAGKAAEGSVENAIRNCLKPGVEFKKLLKGDAILTNGNLRAMPDFLFKVGDKITYLEVKTKIPLKSAKEAFTRAAKQLQAAIDNNANIIGLSFNKLGDVAFKNRTTNLLGALSGNAGMVQFVNGFIDISSFLGDFVIENCL